MTNKENAYLEVREQCDYIQSVAEQNPHSGWISVKDALPSDDNDVFVLTRSKNGSKNADKGYYTGTRWIHRGIAEVTHWMEIPPLEKD